METIRAYFKSPWRVLVYLILCLSAFLWLVPVITGLITSLRTYDEILINGFISWPETITFENFKTAWDRGGLSRYLPNSFIITLPSIVLTMFLSSLAAYALARFKFPANRVIFFTFVGGMMLPFQVLLLPVFKLTDFLGLYDTYWGLIFFHTAFQLGFCTFMLRNYMRTVPGEIIEAARIDGCSEIGIWWKIMLPLTLPAIAAIATLEFTWIFNDYLWAIVLTSNDALKPVTAGLATLQGQFITDWPVIVAGALIGTLPTLLVFLFLQRYFIEGLTLGSSK
ncbi:MAG: carbohydrate ABC transporter permease [Anaerolineae bacterium]|jgi:multiple sugar transport system permease protein|nr:carbohydrate ABC transporter permease [Anaerolineae bacterium]MBT4311388.1 carbohydrate ABC transporter permease [Anaerolineae bacterium]MBT4460207.1 carbohydrate ABC transporter permease [Anaerolineae bacterium]MBT6062816.1 carbohydrate ABC transporter permease [Anaerolineae bacterium]MBT6323477.1 carbohydrate ABC transporter permease [Anaerolineae bacterium]